MNPMLGMWSRHADVDNFGIALYVYGFPARATLAYCSLSVKSDNDVENEGYPHASIRIQKYGYLDDAGNQQYVELNDWSNSVYHPKMTWVMFGTYGSWAWGSGIMIITFWS
jgi:hypothetical protein